MGYRKLYEGVVILKTIIKNGYVVTVNENRDVFPDGYIIIENDKIVDVGEGKNLSSEILSTADKTIDAKNMLVTPGLINMHQHHWYNLFKGVGDGLLLEDWLDRVLFPLGKVMTDQDMKLSGYLACLEMLETGTTCCFDHMTTETTENTIKSIAESAMDVGMRWVIGKEMRHTPEKPMVERYPITNRHPRSISEEIDFCRGIVEKWDGAGNGLIRMALVLETGSNWLLRNATSVDLIYAAIDLARKLNVKISNHMAAGTIWRSIREGIELLGYNDLEYLNKMGVLGPHFILIHCLWLMEREIQMIAESGANAVTCPISNAYSSDGIAPDARMLDAGVNLAIGSDGPMVNNSVDMIEQMKFVSLLHNLLNFDASLVPPEKVLEMTTINAAKALGMEKEIGSLEKGKKADISIFDLRKAHISVHHRPISALIYAGHGTDVHTVLVNGKIVVENGCIKTFPNESELLEEANARGMELINMAGITDLVNRPWPTGTKLNPFHRLIGDRMHLL